MFVALQSNEKFPDEGFDVDVQSKHTSKADLSVLIHHVVMFCRLARRDDW